MGSCLRQELGLSAWQDLVIKDDVYLLVREFLGKLKQKSSQAHGKRFTTTEVLDARKSGTCEACRIPHPATEIYHHACGLGFPNYDCKALCIATGCNGKETEYASKAGQQPGDALRKNYHHE